MTWRRVLALFAVLAALVACGGDDTDAAVDPPTSGAEVCDLVPAEQVEAAVRARPQGVPIDHGADDLGCVWVDPGGDALVVSITPASPDEPAADWAGIDGTWAGGSFARGRSGPPVVRVTALSAASVNRSQRTTAVEAVVVTVAEGVGI